MQVMRLSSKLSADALKKALDGMNALALNPIAIASFESLELAHALAEKSFREKRNIAKQLKFEMLLWLSASRNIANSIAAYGIFDPNDFLLVVLDGRKESLLAKLDALAKPLKLPQQAEWGELERISLGRLS